MSFGSGGAKGQAGKVPSGRREFHSSPVRRHEIQDEPLDFEKPLVNSHLPEGSVAPITEADHVSTVSHETVVNVSPATLAALTKGKLRSQTRSFSTSGCRPSKHLVILGSGWGGYKLLNQVSTKYHQVTVISPRTYFVFTPLLASTAVGTLEFRCAMEPVRSRYRGIFRWMSKKGEGVNLIEAFADNIDFARKKVECVTQFTPVKEETTLDRSAAEDECPGEMSINGRMKDGRRKFEVEYDDLVIAVGAYSQTFGTPGVKEHAYFLKDVGDARRIRARILHCFELAACPSTTEEERRQLLHFVCVGGGPTGVEFAAELHDLIHDDLALLYPELYHLASISLFDVAPRILGSFDENLGEYARAKFARSGIRIRTGTHVTKIEEGKVYTKESGMERFGMMVWATGLHANPLVEEMKGVLKDKRTGSVLTDGRLRVVDEKGQPVDGVYAIGDCAAIKDGEILPATAQVANQKAIYLGNSLNAIARSGTPSYEPEPFKFLNRGAMAYIGGWKAIVQPAKSGGLSGRAAWILWRTAYLSMSVSLRNKILIPTYWLLNFVFGRDITRF
ncbi:FAD/NAD(P)-binding domain-containing protein [Saitoella complicata NRRL Y-17804]|uniref:FAD/NAD(P)-binding domain-containing protein n=1 Tax=Saitoella complicata (strain BCRC 22490 / CBS 7301 / JCM 7358 / NBRC 10748 / NRRL Y-17804) TaxID=698492 RepID=UPI0008675F58|nr:FAD/NAD(P)-binding domain-containing protein [Saitoella complicata NRRL Y-17804]ODQ51308.1 FAD/NAD(P)-binding domain-containing protein [Saitoella complicata NRRL Y-17804]